MSWSTLDNRNASFTSFKVLITMSFCIPYSTKVILTSMSVAILCHPATKILTEFSRWPKDILRKLSSSLLKIELDGALRLDKSKYACMDSMTLVPNLLPTKITMEEESMPKTRYLTHSTWRRVEPCISDTLRRIS
jgi:hypothetical protein